LIDRTFDGRSRNSQSPPTWTQYGHSKNASLRIDQCATLACGAEREIKAQEFINSTATTAAPSSASQRHNAKRRKRGALMIANRKDDLARAEWGLCGRRRC
jgi:hypothetical protein